MKQHHLRIKDGLWTLLILMVVFIINQLIQMAFETQKLIPMIFVLGIFLIALKTERWVNGVGVKMFTIAGSVIVYGVCASVIYGIILVL